MSNFCHLLTLIFLCGTQQEILSRMSKTYVEIWHVKLLNKSHWSFKCNPYDSQARLQLFWSHTRGLCEKQSKIVLSSCTARRFAHNVSEQQWFSCLDS